MKPHCLARADRRALRVHLEFVTAGEAAEEPEQLAFLGLVQPIPAAMFDDVEDMAGLARRELAIVDVMRHRGPPPFGIRTEEECAGPSLCSRHPSCQATIPAPD
nr:hypothetical protein SHINE37_41393 [Rhizobiaceae bacterium]